jgi:hypothetical protein
LIEVIRKYYQDIKLDKEDVDLMKGYNGPLKHLALGIFQTIVHQAKPHPWNIGKTVMGQPVMHFPMKMARKICSRRYMSFIKAFFIEVDSNFSIAKGISKAYIIKPEWAALLNKIPYNWQYDSYMISNIKRYYPDANLESLVISRDAVKAAAQAATTESQKKAVAIFSNSLRTCGSFNMMQWLEVDDLVAKKKVRKITYGFCNPNALPSASRQAMTRVMGWNEIDIEGCHLQILANEYSKTPGHNPDIVTSLKNWSSNKQLRTNIASALNISTDTAKQFVLATIYGCSYNVSHNGEIKQVLKASGLSPQVFTTKLQELGLTQLHADMETASAAILAANSSFVDSNVRGESSALSLCAQHIERTLLDAMCALCPHLGLKVCFTQHDGLTVAGALNTEKLQALRDCLLPDMHLVVKAGPLAGVRV